MSAFAFSPSLKLPTIALLLTLAPPAWGQTLTHTMSGSIVVPMSYPSCDNGEEWLRAHNFPKCSRHVSYDEVCTVDPPPGAVMECVQVPEPR